MHANALANLCGYGNMFGRVHFDIRFEGIGSRRSARIRSMLLLHGSSAAILWIHDTMVSASKTLTAVASSI